MNEIFYHKVGRRYQPINDPYVWDGLTEGIWCIHVKPGSKSARKLIQPDMDSIDAVLIEFKDILIDELREASKLRPLKTKITKKERKAWDVFEATMGKDLPTFFCGYESYQEIANKALEGFKKMVKIKQLRMIAK